MIEGVAVGGILTILVLLAAFGYAAYSAATGDPDGSHSTLSDPFDPTPPNDRIDRRTIPLLTVAASPDHTQAIERRLHMLTYLVQHHIDETDKAPAVGRYEFDATDLGPYSPALAEDIIAMAHPEYDGDAPLQRDAHTTYGGDEKYSYLATPDTQNALDSLDPVDAQDDLEPIVRSVLADHDESDWSLLLDACVETDRRLRAASNYH